MSIAIRRRRRGGWIMLMVLLILLALAFAVAGYYTQSEDHMFTGQAMGAYTMASMRAERGAQDAILQLRSGVANTLSITALCDDKLYNPLLDPVNINNCKQPGFGVPFVNPSTFTATPLDNGPGDLKTGAGLQYDWVIYRPARFASNQNLYGIRAIGYYGYTTGSPNLYSSELEVMIELTSSSNSEIVTSY
jgi:hypothetical protein